MNLNNIFRKHGYSLEGDQKIPKESPKNMDNNFPDQKPKGNSLKNDFFDFIKILRERSLVDHHGVVLAKDMKKISQLLQERGFTLEEQNTEGDKLYKQHFQAKTPENEVFFEIVLSRFAPGLEIKGTELMEALYLARPDSSEQ